MSNKFYRVNDINNFVRFFGYFFFFFRSLCIYAAAEIKKKVLRPKYDEKRLRIKCILYTIRTSG